jgi:uncharacterized protein YqgC (DUF456 family)
MDIVVSILALLAGAIGVAGSILPGLPGPPFSWVGLLLLYIWGTGADYMGNTLTTKALIVWGVVVAVVSIVDYLVPMFFTKVTGGSKYAEKGSLYGMIFGIVFTPVGMILGAFLGALLAELVVAKRKLDEALKSAVGSFLGFILGTGIKTISAVLILWQIIVYFK